MPAAPPSPPPPPPPRAQVDVAPPYVRPPAPRTRRRRRPRSASATTCRLAASAPVAFEPIIFPRGIRAADASRRRRACAPAPCAAARAVEPAVHALAGGVDADRFSGSVTPEPRAPRSARRPTGASRPFENRRPSTIWCGRSPARVCGRERRAVRGLDRAHELQVPSLMSSPHARLTCATRSASRRPEPVHLSRPRLRRAEKLALARELRVLHPRALRQRREPVGGDGPQTRRVVLTAHLVE